MIEYLTRVFFFLFKAERCKICTEEFEQLKSDLAERNELLFKIKNDFAEFAILDEANLKTLRVATSLTLNSAQRSLDILSGFRPMEKIYKSGDRLGEVK